MAVNQLESRNTGNNIRTLWSHLTEPPTAVQNIEQRRRMQLLSAILVSVLPLAVLAGLTVPFVTHPEAPWKSATFTAAFSAFFAFIVAYALNRAGHYRTAAWITVATFLFAPYTAVILDDSPNSINRAFISILVGGALLASILFAERRPLMITLVTGALQTVIYPIFLPGHDFSLVFAPVVTFGAIAALTLLYDDHRTKLENDRQRELSDALRRSEEANAGLIKANAVAKEATRLKSEFMATMSHELRTPLNATLGFSGVLLEGMSGEFDAKTRHMIERIEANSKRLLSLINDILDIAKIEAGRLELVSVAISPAKLAESWHSQMGVLAERKGLAFEIDIDPTLPDQISGDPERISQIATNLLSNAFKFTEKGSVKLSMKRADANWLIEVSDTGMGIPPHAMNYIFDEFRQVDGSTRRSFGGTGLGLAIARNLCRMMDGNIRVASVLGQGSTFTVTLPLQTALQTQSV